MANDRWVQAPCRYRLRIAPRDLLEAFGILGLFAIVFAESGLLFGFFLPGDSLLFTAGLLVSTGEIDAPLVLVLAGCFVAAVAGDQVGYAFGQRVGPALFRRPDSRIFHQRHVDRARRYFEAHGPRTIVLARFVPVVRTFAPILAGVGEMPYRTFVRFNVLGALLWAVGVTSAGYALGETVPDVDRYLLPIIGLVVVASLVPALVEIWRERGAHARRQAAELAVAEEAGPVD